MGELPPNSSKLILHIHYGINNGTEQTAYDHRTGLGWTISKLEVRHYTSTPEFTGAEVLH